MPPATGQPSGRWAENSHGGAPALGVGWAGRRQRPEVRMKRQWAKRGWSEWNEKLRRGDRPVPGDAAVQLRGSWEAASPGLLPCLGPASSCPPLTGPGTRELWAQSRFLDINGSTEEPWRPRSYRQNCERPSGQQTSKAKWQSLD